MAKYRKYSDEFKLQAAKLVTEQGYSYDKAATTAWHYRLVDSQLTYHSHRTGWRNERDAFWTH